MADRAGMMSHQIVHAAIDQVILVFPGLGHAARLGMMFEDDGAVAIHAAETTGGQSGHAGPDDDDGFFCHDFACSSDSPPGKLLKRAPANRAALACSSSLS